jgi:hypothetical protein
MEGTMLTDRRLVQLLFACLVAMTPIAGLVAPARAVVGGYVEVHELGCPPGYSPDALFRDCHDHRLAGVDLIADGPGGRRYTDATDQYGRVVFGDFLEAGPVTVAEARMTGEYVDYVVYCTRQDNRQPVDVEKHTNGRAAFVVDLPQDVVDTGTGVVCDWYNLPEPPGSATPSPGTVPSGAIGETRSAWIEIYGNPQSTDGLDLFGKGGIAVAFDGEIATFVELVPMGDGLSQARARAATFLPNDASLVREYAAPSTTVGPILTAADEYTSAVLASTLAAAGIDGDGSILVVYQLAPPRGAPAPADGPLVAAITITVGTAPPDTSS